jgi:hypothetical protein
MIPASPITTPLAWIETGAIVSPRRPDPDNKARTKNDRRAVPRRREPVHRADTAAMRLDDLARNRKPKSRILAKALIRPVGIKTLEDALEGIGWNAGAVVIDNDLETLGQQTIGRRALRRT